MGIAHKSTDWSDPAATMLLYDSFGTAVAAQRDFESQSLAHELSAQLGEYGLHFAHVTSDVGLLLRAGAPIDGVRIIDYGDGLQHWESPLLTACVDERFAVAESLIRFGAAVDAPNAVRYPNGSGFAHTALHMVIARRDRVGAERLIAAGADIDRRTSLGSTPLYYAANNDDVQMVALLLRGGARPDIPDFKGLLPADSAGPKTRPLLTR